MDSGMDSYSDESRGEEYSLANKARQADQITMSTNSDMLELEGTKFSGCLTMMLPRIVLLSCNIGLIFAIAMVYHFLEGDNEKMERVKFEMNIGIAERNFMTKLHTLTPSIPDEKVHREMLEFGREMMRMGWTKGRSGVPLSEGMIQPNSINNINNDNYDGATGKQQQYDHPNVWTWANSFLFAISVISQIGYGHLFPLTSLGKILLVPFAIVGLPLFLVTIADLGRFIVELLNVTYRRIIWKFYRKCLSATQQKMHWNRKPQPSAATAGSGIIKPNNQNASMNSKSQQRKTPNQEMAEEKLNPAASEVSLDMDNFSTTTEQRGEYFDENAENWEKVRIPLPVIFLLFIPLWSLLALFYRHAEGWAWLDCFYFTFVSFTRIGFGDFVPTTALSTLLTICLIFPMGC